MIAIAVLLNILLERIDRRNEEVLKLNKQITNHMEMMEKSEELSNMGTWRLSLKTQKSIWSNGLYQIFGITPNSITPSLEKRLELSHPDDREMIRKAIANSIDTKSSVRIDSRIIRPDGSTRWISSIGYTEYNETGKPETYIGSFIDITDRKAYEQELYHEKEKFRITITSIGDGVIATDEKGNITLLNEQAEKLTGWEQKDATGKPFDEVFNMISEETREKRESPIPKVIKSGLILGLANHTALISKYGAEYSIADSAAPIKDRHGIIKGVVIVFRDVTEEKKRQEQISYISYHDSLTGLYNRRFFEEQLREIDTAENLPISIIMGDVNGLKVTNDAFGHAEGDRLLQRASDAIRAACRSDDIIARWGGDEFVVLLPKTEKSAAEDIVERIMEIEAQMKVGPINVSVSFGCGVKKEESDNILKALKNAEDHMYENKLSESEGMKGNLINSILNTLYEKNPDEVDHFNRVGDLSQKIGKALHLPKEDLSKLKSIGRFHDIGKIAVSNSILKKQGPLTPQEWDEIKRHPDIGYKILKSSRETVHLSEYVLSHHERYDGKGYPSGLKGEEIPLLSRIVSVADSFDAMTNDRSYRRALSATDALDELVKNKETQFDPTVVDAFVELLKVKAE
ncbi:MAG TPA: HD domain-containing phosphohydrolase [Clostridia bacterium]|nr:HD domain-containing phosphohydrolase [Clostridia bacterium]